MPSSSKTLVATMIPSVSISPSAGPSTTHMAQVTRQVLDRRVEPAQGPVHQQLRGRHGMLGYSHGPGNGETGIG
jgi:hypothetical protein